LSIISNRLSPSAGTSSDGGFLLLQKVPADEADENVTNNVAMKINVSLGFIRNSFDKRYSYNDYS
jgi:hypothetical protein